jgi:hypothetical protein
MLNMDTRNPNSDVKPTNIPVRVSTYANISILSLDVNGFHFLLYIFDPLLWNYIQSTIWFDPQNSYTIQE